MKKNIFIITLGSFLAWFFLLDIYKIFKAVSGGYFRTFSLSYVLIIIYGSVLVGLYYKKIWLKALSGLFILLYLFWPFSKNLSYLTGKFLAMVQAFSNKDVVSFSLFLIASVIFLILFASLFSKKLEKSVIFSVLFLIFALPYSTGLFRSIIIGNFVVKSFIEFVILFVVYAGIFWVIKKKG